MSDNFTDTFSRHAHFVERYKSQLVNQISPFLNRVTKSLRAELLKTNTVNSRARIKAKLEFVENLMLVELGGYTEEIGEQLELFAQSESGFAAKALENADETFTAVLPAPAQLNAAVSARPFNTKLLQDYFENFTKEQAQAVRNAVSLGFAEGRTTQEIVREIVGTKSAGFKDGLLNVTRQSAQRMVRTSIAHTSSVARREIYEDNEIPYYEWVSTLDSRTSDTCKSLDGEVFKTGKGRLPPAHLNCRSTTSPLYADEVTKDKNGNITKKPNLGGTRASEFGPVSADESYNDWLGKQSKAFQVEALGPTKAKLFREGGLRVDQFTNREDAPLTLKELEKKFPLAFDKAGI